VWQKGEPRTLMGVFSCIRGARVLWLDGGLSGS